MYSRDELVADGFYIHGSPVKASFRTRNVSVWCLVRLREHALFFPSFFQKDYASLQIVEMLLGFVGKKDKDMGW